MNQIVKIPQAKNEPVKSYAPGDSETLNLKSKLQEMKNTPVDIPMYIGSKEIFTEEKISMHPPHEINHTLGTFNKGNASHVKAAISAALEAKESWAKMPWESRAAFLESC